MSKKKETIVSVIALAVGASLLGKVMRHNCDTTDSVSGFENENEVLITCKANRIAKTSTAYIYWDTINYVYVVEDFRYPDGNGRYLIYTLQQGNKINKATLLNAYDNFQNNWGV